jgi:glycosyltransferase involved in cell wall biosynthesis
VHAFEYTALASFERAKAEGVARVLHLPSLDSLHFETIQQREKRQWPELIGAHDAYFARMFAKRYERRRREIALADVIVTNSSLTARSHITAGADASKVFVVPLGAPLTVEKLAQKAKPGKDPLVVIWAGTFSLRKGAHYLMKAWCSLSSGSHARLDVYGRVTLPQRLKVAWADSVLFHGSVPKPLLYNAFKCADVLVFPTLSDGFGMVVTEALSHGLPVITTDQAGAADLIIPGENGLIVPAADPRALADALRWCLDNREKLHSMRLGALETARRRQWPDYRRDLMSVLDNGLRRAGYKPAFSGGE